MHTGFVAPDRAAEERFWAFVRDRQEAWYRRFVLKLPQPEWTGDPVLRTHGFPNAYRELDPGTQFAVEAVLEDQSHEEYWQAIAHLVTYRLFNLVEPYTTIAPLVTEAAHGCDHSLAAIGLMVDQMLAERYRTFGVGTPAPIAVDGESVGDAVAALLKDVYGLLSNVETSILSGHCSLRQLRDSLNHYKDKPYGARRAFMCAYDMTLPLLRRRGRPLAEVNALEWAQVTDSAHHGLALMGVAGPEAALVRAVRGMHAKQVDELHPLGFKWLRDGAGTAVPLDMGSIARCLGMHATYARIAAGRPRAGGWKPASSGVWRPAHITLPARGPWHEPWEGRTVAC